MFSHNGDNGAELNTSLRFVGLARWRHRGRSLMSTITLLYFLADRDTWSPTVQKIGCAV